MAKIEKPIGLLGGTFDPIHNGHLRIAIELYEQLDLEEVRFIPSAYPPHREMPSTSAELRLKMVQAAIEGTKGLVVDDRELQRNTPSYSIDTLRSFREEFPTRSLCLILGMDAFAGLAKWHEWEKLIEFTHIIVVRRPGKLLPNTHVMQEFLIAHKVSHYDTLIQKPAGYIWIQDIPPLTISATQIRALIATEKNPRYLLPSSVVDIIYANQLYT